MSETLVMAIWMSGATLVLAVAGHVVAAMSRAGTLTRNGAVGIRTRTTMHSDGTWRAAHLAAAPWHARGARLGYLLGGLAIALTLLSGRAETSTAAAVAAVAGLLTVTAVLLAGGVVGQRAARELRNRERSPRSPGRG